MIKCKGSGSPKAGSLALAELRGASKLPCGFCGKWIKVLKSGNLASHRRRL